MSEEAKTVVSPEAKAGLGSLARQIAVLHAAKQHHTEIAESIGGRIQELSKALYEEFANQGLSTMRISCVDPATGKPLFPDGQDRIVSPNLHYAGHAPADLKPKFFEWLREHESGSLVHEEVNPRTLGSWIKERLQKQLELPPEYLLKVTPLETVNVRKAPQKAQKGSEE